jgi:hypothetical protein
MRKHNNTAEFVNETKSTDNVEKITRATQSVAYPLA